MLYLTFCDKMWQILIQEMDKEGGNKERMRKCREWISLHSLILSPFLRSLALRLQQVAQPCLLLTKMPLVAESVQRGPFWLYMKDIRNLLLPLRIKMKSGFLWDSDQDVLSSAEAGADLQDSPVHHHLSLYLPATQSHMPSMLLSDDCIGAEF